MDLRTLFPSLFTVVDSEHSRVKSTLPEEALQGYVCLRTSGSVSVTVAAPGFCWSWPVSCLRLHVLAATAAPPSCTLTSLRRRYACVRQGSGRPDLFAQARSTCAGTLRKNLFVGCWKCGGAGGFRCCQELVHSACRRHFSEAAARQAHVLEELGSAGADLRRCSLAGADPGVPTGGAAGRRVSSSGFPGLCTSPGEEPGKLISSNSSKNHAPNDTTLLAESEEDLKHLLMKIKDHSLQYGVHLNIKKTKILTTGPVSNIMINRERLKLSTISFDLDPQSTAMEAAVKKSKDALHWVNLLQRVSSVLKSKDVTLKIKVRLTQATVFLITSYACESWTMNKEDQRRIGAFELWCWRRI
ncbi:uncharacterized protein LOC126062576 [Elephas maximus indicus]|uniref:uncharacterized protein LOC126062576 n=1 Tax=Elephas maximus indicus TaxID=99487 RepID=UPI0021162660|nr:uncharacterized protein LOC126062576 [Elephas maximus indicus]